MHDYRITPANPNGHLFDVELTIKHPLPEQTVSLPNWIPGSYLIRDFSKHIIGLHAQNKQGHAVELTNLDSSTWQLSNTEGAVTLYYQVYAWDLSVRGAHFDQSHAFFNGTSMFLAVNGQRELPCQVEIVEPNWLTNDTFWQVATGMPETKTDANGFGTYVAEDYMALIDYPVEMGTFECLEFEACGVPHKMVLTGLFDLDKERLKADLIKICETEIKLFGEPAPMDSFLFQVMVTGSDYGGLEHRNSTALMCSRDDLPYPGMEKATDGYLQFLELCSHEYFHCWNVKRIQPKVYQTTDLKTPVYTNQLWWFEGITSYYDALILLRAGLVDSSTYLKGLAEQMTRVYRMPGRFKQSTAESSWLTWTKFYQQDENAPNAIISYYGKGSLIALGLDLTIRQQTQQQKSLDDIMLYLWEHYGLTGTGLEELEIETICSQVSGLDLSDFFNRYLYGTEDLPFTEWFQQAGIEFSQQAARSLTDKGGPNDTPSLASHLGANAINTEHQTLKLTHVWEGQPAYEAGLSAGDEIIAINQLKIKDSAQLESRLKRLPQAGATWHCTFFRRDELRQTQIHLTPAVADRVVLSAMKNQHSEWLASNQPSDSETTGAGA